MPAPGSLALTLGGLLSIAAALAHLACIAIGAPAYRFMGAGERVARAAEAGRIEPTLVTLGIAAMLSVWAAYAFSGARLIAPLPFTVPVLALISVVLLARGLGFPLIMAAFPGNSMGFWLVSSGLCVAMGTLHAYGAWRLWQAATLAH